VNSIARGTFGSERDCTGTAFRFCNRNGDQLNTGRYAVQYVMSTLGVTLGPRADRVIQWLLDGDPAIRWQVLRDLVGAAERTVEHERRKVARDGWGARLLAKQDPEGTWAGGLSSDGGLYSPKWISTTYTMLMLRDFGLPATNRQTRKACALLLDGGLQHDGGINYGWRGRSETCITGIVASILSYFKHDDGRLDTIPLTCSGSRCPTVGGIASARLAQPTLPSTRP